MVSFEHLNMILFHLLFWNIIYCSIKRRHHAMIPIDLPFFNIFFNGFVNCFRVPPTSCLLDKTNQLR